MRLIDADALLMHLADAVFGNAPGGNEPPDERDLKRAWCDGMESAEEAVKAAPTVIVWAANPDEYKPAPKPRIAHCADCGRDFMQNTKRQKYCPLCGSLAARAARHRRRKEEGNP